MLYFRNYYGMFFNISEKSFLISLSFYGLGEGFELIRMLLSVSIR